MLISLQVLLHLNGMKSFIRIANDPIKVSIEFKRKHQIKSAKRIKIAIQLYLTRVTSEELDILAPDDRKGGG